jgi:hypothetical protein
MKHSSSSCRKLIKKLRKLGVHLEEKRNGFLLTHPKAKEAYLMHYGEKAIHPVRRWVKRELKVDINS